MMKYYYFIFIINFYFCSAQIIRQVYFDKTYSLTTETKDGAVVVETMDMKKSLICNDNFGNSEAQVICRMMGYSGGSSAGAVLSNRHKNSKFPLRSNNFKCRGDETTIELCENFESNMSECPSSKMIIHVFCNADYKFMKSLNIGMDNVEAIMTNKLTEGGNIGLMNLKINGTNYTLCGLNNNFGQNEARLFCKMLKYDVVQYARIISNYEVRGAAIGGFRNMKCPPDAISLADCTYVNAEDKELCTPVDNIGISCESEPLPINPQPDIECSRNEMTLIWKKKLFPDADEKYVNLIQNGYNCTLVNKSTNETAVKLRVSLDNCSPVIEGQTDTLVFRYQVQRVFPKKENLVVRNTQHFFAHCYLERKEVVNITNIELNVDKLKSESNNLKLSTKLELSTDFNFATVLEMPYRQKIGTVIYGKIELLNAPSQIRLVLNKCVIYNNKNMKKVLIENKCIQEPSVKINPINNKIIKFSYKSFTLGHENEDLNIKCDTSKCSISERNCFASCIEPGKSYL